MKTVLTLTLALAMAVGCFAQSADDDKTVYQYKSVDVMPEFPGGPDSLIVFLEKNTKNPVKLKKSLKMKKVIIEFIVEKDGTLSEKTIIKSQTAAANREAFRVVLLMPKWTPGKIGGMVVRVKSLVSIPFLLP